MADEKILENEKLSDEELDNVAGGTCYETAKDSRFLNSLNGSTDRYSNDSIFWRSLGGDEVFRAWKALGIYLESHRTCTDDNRYYIMQNGKRKEISQEAAREYAMEITGKFMSRAEWDW